MSAEMWRLLTFVQDDLRSAQTKLVELRAQLASLDLPERERVECPDCSVALAGARALAEHTYLQHNGPEPQHWLEAEQRSDT